MNNNCARRIVVLLLAAVNFMGCSAISGTSSMRIDVSVYNGPLSLEPQLQVAALQGVIDELFSNLEHFKKLQELQWQQSGFGYPRFKFCKNDDELSYFIKLYESYKRAQCSILAGLISDTEQLLELRENLDTDKAELRENLHTEKTGPLARLAMRLEMKAMFWGHTQIAVPMFDRVMRMQVNAFANALAEYSNQVAARVDAMQKHNNHGPKNNSADRFATSVFLRDAKTTDFQNLYIWNRAGAYDNFPDLILHPVESLSSESTANKVRIFERLVDDHNWTLVNTVFASGRGKVNMAFVKDDIGNWNLFRFDNEPEELLEAYSAVVEKTAEAAATAISSGSTVVANEWLSNLSTLAKGQFDTQQAPISSTALARQQAALKANLQQLMEKAALGGQNEDTRKQVVEEISRTLSEYQLTLNTLQSQIASTTKELNSRNGDRNE